MHIVSEMVDIGKARSLGMTLLSFDGQEINIIDGAFITITVDKIDQLLPDSLDCRDVQLHRARI